MKSSTRSALLSLCLALGPASALAAENWTVNYLSGAAVMDEISPITFTVANAATSTKRINKIVLQLPGPTYDIDSGLAPVGWVVSTVDKKNQKVTFSASGTSCPRGI